MLNLQNVSATTMFKFFGIPCSLLENLFSALNIETIGDLKSVMNEKPIIFNKFANPFVKRDCQMVIMKTEFLEKNYSLKGNNLPFSDLNMICDKAKVISEEKTKGSELILSSLVEQDKKYTYYFLNDLNITQIKDMFRYQNSTSKPLILKAAKMGIKNFQVLINGINLFDEQLIRQSKEIDYFEGDLFHLNYEEKKAIVLDELESYIDYLEKNAEFCVWGENNAVKIRLMREALISKSVAALRNKERLINTFTNYTTLSELEQGIVKNKTLNRFIIR